MTPRLVVLAALIALFTATVYEALVALGAIDLGSQPGDGPLGEGWVRLIALLAMLAGGAMVAVAPKSRHAALVAPATAAFLLARFYTFDPYYLPTLRRISDQGLLSPVLVYLVVALAVGVALLSGRWPAVTRYLGPPIVLAAALLAFFAGGGH